MENKYGGGPSRTIYHLRKNQAEKKVESVPQTDIPMKEDLSEKTTDMLLDEIREQQIELIKRGLCPKCKAVTRPEKATPNKRPRDPPQRPQKSTKEANPKSVGVPNQGARQGGEG